MFVRFSWRTLFLSTLVVVFAALAVGAPQAGLCDDKQYVIKAITSFETNNIAFKPMPQFLEMVEKESGGRLKIDWLGGPEVVKTFDQPEALRSGMIDMILYIPTAYFKPILPVAEAKGCSMMTGPEERQSGAFAVWQEVFRSQCNAEILGFWATNLQFQLFTKDEITTLADLKGKILRVMPLYVPFVKALGASPITLPPPEVYTALQRGVINGFIFLEMGTTPFGWHEITRYRINPTFLRGEAAMAVNLDKFNSLPPDLQQVLKNCMIKMEVEGNEILKGVLDEEHEIMKKSGMKVIDLPEADGQKLRKVSYDITWEQVIKNAPNYGPRLKELTTKK